MSGYDGLFNMGEKQIPPKFMKKPQIIIGIIFFKHFAEYKVWSQHIHNFILLNLHKRWILGHRNCVITS